MAFFVNLIAVRWQGNKYDVCSQTDASIDIWLLDQKGLMTDVSQNTSYLDEMAVLPRHSLPQYLVDRGQQSYAKARAWYDSLPEHAQFVLVHRGEWSSGLGK